MAPKLKEGIFGEALNLAILERFDPQPGANLKMPKFLSSSRAQILLFVHKLISPCTASAQRLRSDYLREVAPRCTLEIESR